jgi:protein TorT
MRTAIPLWPRPRSTWIAGCLLTAIGASVLLLPTTARGGDTEPFPVDVWESPLSQPRQHVRKAYAPLAHATKQWHVCASIPHLKDDYWLAVNFALIQEARRLGVRLDLFEVGGYQHLQTQKQQISKCVEGGANGLIVGAISADGLNDLIASYADRRIPVVNLINGVRCEEVAARVGADFYDMGPANISRN